MEHSRGAAWSMTSDHIGRKWTKITILTSKVPSSAKYHIMTFFYQFFVHFHAPLSLIKCSYRPCGTSRVFHNVCDVFKGHNLPCNTGGLSYQTAILKHSCSIYDFTKICTPEFPIDLLRHSKSMILSTFWDPANLTHPTSSASRIFSIGHVTIK